MWHGWAFERALGPQNYSPSNFQKFTWNLCGVLTKPNISRNLAITMTSVCTLCAYLNFTTCNECCYWYLQLYKTEVGPNCQQASSRTQRRNYGQQQAKTPTSHISCLQHVTITRVSCCVDNGTERIHMTEFVSAGN